MSLEKLVNQMIREGKLKKQPTDSTYLNNLLVASKRNFDAARLVKNNINEAAFKLVYDGLLQIGRVVLLVNGYRPDDGEQHKTTFYIAGEILGNDYAELISRIQRFRIKRNNCVYEPIGFISKVETDAIFDTAKEFWLKTKKYLESKDRQLKLFKDI